MPNILRWHSCNNFWGVSSLLAAETMWITLAGMLWEYGICLDAEVGLDYAGNKLSCLGCGGQFTFQKTIISSGITNTFRDATQNLHWLRFVVDLWGEIVCAYQRDSSAVAGKIYSRKQWPGWLRTFTDIKETFFHSKPEMFTENITCLTWSQGQMIPPENIKRYPMATKQAQMTREKTRRSFLKIDSIQTRTNTAKKMASAVGTVMTKATWSSTFWEETAWKTETGWDWMYRKRSCKGNWAHMKTKKI